jgi:hypothetical protein
MTGRLQEGCLHALESLKRLEDAMSLIPQDVEIAGPGHSLAGFSGCPVTRKEILQQYK